jgi:hypothetical protein
MGRECSQNGRRRRASIILTSRSTYKKRHLGSARLRREYNIGKDLIEVGMIWLKIRIIEPTGSISHGVSYLVLILDIVGIICYNALHAANPSSIPTGRNVAKRMS